MTDDYEERQRRRILRWGKKQGIIGADRMGPILFVVYQDGHEEEIDYTPLIEQGLVDRKTLELTPAGELKLAQLEQREWMAKNGGIGPDGRYHLHRKEGDKK